MSTEDKSESDSKSGESLSSYILPSAGTIVGLCATLIGFVKINEARMGQSSVDELSGLVALVFLVSGVSAYLAIRYKNQPQLNRRFETVADWSFLFGLVSLGIVTLLFAYELV